MNNSLLVVLLLVISWELQAASPPPKENIHFMAEHLAEAAQDARYYAMPWPDGEYADQAWRPLVSVAGSYVDADLANARGGLLTLGVSRSWQNNWSTDFVVYYDRFAVSGGQSENSLLAFSVNGVPLDLPETARFSNPQGEFTHAGLGVIVSHALDIQDADWRWDVIGGMLIESLDLAGYTLEYELLSGLDTGTTGILDHSGSSHFIYYVIGLQAKKMFAGHYIIIPRFIYGRPRSDGDFVTRLTVSGVEYSTAATGAEPHHIGDEFGYFGMTVRDTRSHLEIDIGAIPGFAVYEYVVHEGINTAFVVSLTWRM